MGSTADDADLVLAVHGGDQAAFGELFARWSDRCYDVARRIVHDDGIAAEVAQDVFLVAWQQLGSLRDPAAFGGWVLRSARNRALNRLEKERRSVSVADDAPTLSLVAAADAPDRDVEAAMTALDHQELVAAATVVLGEREASVLDLHLRHGLSAAELAEELGVTANNAHQLIFRTKKKLAAGIRAWVLVRGGRPSCAALAVALDDAGAQEFGRTAVGVIGDHVPGCEECTARQAAVLDPAALFAAAPVVAMAPGVRATVLEGLRAAGVPVGGPPTAEAATPDRSTTEPDRPSAVRDRVELAEGPPSVAADGADRRRRRVLAAAAVLLLLAGGALVAGTRDGDDEPVAAGPTTTIVEATTTRPSGEPRQGTTTSIAAAPAPAPPSTTTAPDALAPATTLPADATGTTAPAEEQPAPTTPTTPTATPTTAPPRPTTTATTTTTRPPAPIVRRFDTATATTRGGECPPARFATTIWWLVDGATTVTIEADGVGPLTGLATSGKRVICRFPAGPPTGWKLTATGPGGTVTDTA